MVGNPGRSLIGQVLSGGRYRVDAALGEGGMGVVYRAWDNNLGTEVVVKVPHASMLQDAEFATRFSREIRSLVALSHPHIVKISDVGETDGLPFAVMQFLPGGSLEDRQRTKAGGETQPLRPDSLEAWLPSVAEALDFVHQQGYIHRDVKPANILFDAHGHAYLSDFGIAKLAAASHASAGSKTVTGAGLVIGTPEYMAPELIMGHRIDGGVDQYALAVTTFEILAGRRPFEDATSTAVLVQHSTKEPPDLSSLSSNASAGLAAVLRKALSKSSGDRFANCRKFAEAVLSEVRASSATNDIRVNCPICDKIVKLSDKMRGRGVICPGCQTGLRVSDDLRQLVVSKSAGDAAAGGTGTKVVRAPTPASSQAMKPSETPRAQAKQTALRTVNNPSASPSTQTSAIGSARPSTKTVKPPISPKKSSGITEPPVSPPEQASPTGRNKLVAVGTGCATVILLVVITVFVMTGRGFAKITVKGSDESAQVTVDGNDFTVADLDKPLALTKGPHQLTVTAVDFETVTKSFIVVRGTTIVVDVELQPTPRKRTVAESTMPTVTSLQSAPIDKVNSPPPSLKFDLPPATEMRRPADADAVAAAKLEEAVRKIASGGHVAAVKELEEALKVDPGLAFKKVDAHDKIALNIRALLYDDNDGQSPQSAALQLYRHAFHASRAGEYTQAITDYKAAFELDPGCTWAANNLAWLLATCLDLDLRDGKLAVEYAKKACHNSSWCYSSFQNTLAAALAEAGAYEQAVLVTKLSKENYTGVRGSEEELDEEEWALDLMLYEQRQRPDYSKSIKSEQEKYRLTKAIALKYVADSKNVSLLKFCSIDESAAAVLGATQGELDLQSLAQLTDASAVELAKHRGSLNLGELTTLTETAAIALSTHVGPLFLDRLRSISEPVASILGRSLADTLSFDGLTSLSPESAAALAEHREAGTTLMLDGLKKLPQGVAAGLAKHQGDLFLQGITALSESEAAALSEHRGGQLLLSSIRTITPSVAAALSSYKHVLGLDGIIKLDDDVASALAKHHGMLTLRGVEAMPAPIAEVLAKSNGILVLDGLMTLPDDVAIALATNRGTLILGGLKQISETTAAHLAKHQGELSLSGLANVSPSIAAALAKHPGKLVLNGITSLTDDEAAALAPHKNTLVLNGVTTLTASQAASLTRHQGGLLYLNGITSLSATVASRLAKYQGRLVLGGIKDLDGNVADSFSKHNERLELPNLSRLSESAATALASGKGTLVFHRFDVVKDLGPIIAKHEGGIWFEAVNELPEDVAVALIEYRGGICFFDVGEISVETAKIIARYQARGLVIGVNTLADDVSAALSKYQGANLSLPFLTDISDTGAAALAKYRGELSVGEKDLELRVKKFKK